MADQLHAELTWRWLDTDNDAQLSKVEHLRGRLGKRSVKSNFETLTGIAKELLEVGAPESAHLKRLMEAPQSMRERLGRAAEILRGLQQIYPVNPPQIDNGHSTRVRRYSRLTNEQAFGAFHPRTAVNLDLHELLHGTNVMYQLARVEKRIAKMIARAGISGSGSALQLAHEMLSQPAGEQVKPLIYKPFRGIG
jgi:hypothetical protein